MLFQDDTWVQCEDPSCLKWRRVPKSVPKLFCNKPWFCKDNTLNGFNSCDVPEQNQLQVVKAAKMRGFKYIHSELPPGTLVWAKMIGYCRWPGIVSDDPNGDSGHVFRDFDGEPLEYHVEYLGNPRSRGWLKSQHVDLYGYNNFDHCKLKRGQLHGSRSKKERSRYRAINVEFAIEEADKMILMSNKQRLDQCQFSSKKLEKSSIHSYTKQLDSAIHSDARTSSIPKPKLNSLQCSANILDFSTTMIDKTKEEKFALDVEMYQKNQRAFEHDVRRFFIRNGCPSAGHLPCWNNHRVSLFQLFLIVRDKGGYEQVKKNGGWSSVYKEFTGKCSGGHQAKKYYERNLLAYEYYLARKDYKPALPIRKTRKQNESVLSDSSDTILETERAIGRSAPFKGKPECGGHIQSASKENVVGFCQDDPEVNAGKYASFDDGVALTMLTKTDTNTCSYKEFGSSNMDHCVNECLLPSVDDANDSNRDSKSDFALLRTITSLQNLIDAEL